MAERGRQREARHRASHPPVHTSGKKHTLALADPPRSGRSCYRSFPAHVSTIPTWSAPAATEVLCCVGRAARRRKIFLDLHFANGMNYNRPIHLEQMIYLSATPSPFYSASAIVSSEGADRMASAGDPGQFSSSNPMGVSSFVVEGTGPSREQGDCCSSDVHTSDLQASPERNYTQPGSPIPRRRHS